MLENLEFKRKFMKTGTAEEFIYPSEFNSFVLNASFFYSLKTSENLMVF